MCIAASRGDIDIVRYILTRTFGDVKGKNCGWGMDSAAHTGNVDVFTFAHDMFAQPMSRAKPCQCDKSIGRAAWGAGRADVALWMHDFGCAGYCPPTIDQLCEAIIQGYSTLPAIAQHMGPITDPSHIRRINNAAACMCSGSAQTILAILDSGLPINPMALFVSAASVDDIEAMALVTDRCPPTRHMVRAAIVSNTFDAEDGDALATAWLVERWPDVVDPALVTACITKGALAVVRRIDPLVQPPFDWQRAAGAVLASQNVEMIAYAIEQKGVVMDETTIVLTAGFVPHAPAAAYLVQRCGLERTQALYDMAATLWDREPTFSITQMPLTGREDGLCLDAYRTMFWAHERSCEATGPMLTCDCVKCGAPGGQRPAKRRRVKPRPLPSSPTPLSAEAEMMAMDGQPS